MAIGMIKPAGGLSTADKETARQWMVQGHSLMNGKIQGGIPARAAATITPGTAAQTIAAGQYLEGVQTVLGDPALEPGNIRSGASIFGVEGNYICRGIYMQGFGSSGVVTLPAGKYVFCGMSSAFAGYNSCPAVILYVAGKNRCAITTGRKYSEYNGSGYSVKSDVIQLELIESSNCEIVITDIEPRNFFEWGIGMLCPT